MEASPSAVVAVPGSCYVRPISVEETYGLQVSYCQFDWRASPQYRRTSPRRQDAARVPANRPPPDTAAGARADE